MNKRRPKLLLAGVLAMVLAISLMAGCSPANQQANASAYTDITVTKGDVRNTLSLEGYLTPSQNVDIKAQESSRVAKILEPKNHKVSKGDPVIRLENGNTVKAPVKGKITKIYVSVGDWVDSTVTIGTMNDTSSWPYQSKTLSSDGSTYVSKVNFKEGDTVAAGDKIVEYENGNSVKAPFAGIISSLSVDVNDKVETDTAICTVVDTSGFYIEVSVNEIDAQKLQAGQRVDVTINALDATATGKVSEISPTGTVENDETNFTVKIQLDAQNSAIKTNMSAKVEILIAEAKNVITIPVDAVQSVNGKKFVMKKNGTTYALQEVTTGISNSSYVEIKSGLSEGDTIGMTSADSMFPGINMKGGNMVVTQAGPGTKTVIMQGGPAPAGK